MIIPVIVLTIQCNNQSIEVEEFMVIKNRAAIAAIKMAFIRQQASLTHQKEIKRLLPTGRCR
jgi:hypothetical protein